MKTLMLLLCAVICCVIGIIGLSFYDTNKPSDNLLSALILGCGLLGFYAAAL